MKLSEILTTYQQAYDNPSGNEWLKKYKSGVESLIRENQIEGYWKKQLRSTFKNLKRVPKQDLAIYSNILEEIEKEVRYSIVQDCNHKLPNVKIGTILSNKFNTKTIPCKNGDFIIAVDTNVLEFTLAILIIVFDRYFFDIKGDSGVLFGNKCLDVKPDNDFEEILLSCLVVGNTINIVKILPSPKMAMLIEVAFRAILIFLVSHEYGHILNRDFTKLKTKENAEKTNNWLKEYSCDSFGLSKVIGLLSKKFSLTFPFIGVQFFFSLLNLIDEIYPDLNRETATHPLSEMRRENIKDCLRIGCPNHNFLDLFSLVDSINSTLLNLWKVNSASFYKKARNLVVRENIEIDKNSELYKRLFKI